MTDSDRGHARHRAEMAALEFSGTKRVMLRDVGRERKTQRQALVMLRRRYDLLMRAYLRESGTTYEAWLEHGPKAEWDEVLEAARLGNDHLWDALVDKHAERPC